MQDLLTSAAKTDGLFMERGMFGVNRRDCKKAFQG